MGKTVQAPIILIAPKNSNIQNIDRQPKLKMIRAAVSSDIVPLLDIENTSFQYDRIKQRNFLHLLTQANSITLVDEEDKQIRGYLTLLFRSKSSVSRVYSIATNSAFLRLGVASKLLCVAEKISFLSHKDAMLLEIRTDNLASLAFFQTHGYHKFGEYPFYYQDGMTANRLQKRLTQKKCAKASSMTGNL